MRVGAIGRRNAALAASGVLFGFLSASFVLLLIPTDRNGASNGKSRPKTASRGFLPDSPHSHGEMDRLIGPEEAQQWNDFEDESHQSEVHTIASELKQKVRILCWVMTSPYNIQTKARHVNATWGQRCNILVFMSSLPDPSLPAIGLNVLEGRDNLWAKTKAAFKYVYKNHFTDADWFLKADDDTYAVIENLRYLLKDYNPDDPIYFGRRFRPYVKQGYMSGGAGYVLSREALKRFVTVALVWPNICSQKNSGPEDLEIGRCLQNCGIKAMDSRDKFGRERFHPFPPDLHLIPGAVSKGNWYWDYNYYPIREGPDCCSDFAVTFHYIPPQLMYVFEYLIYHMRPHGLMSNLVLPVPDENLPNDTIVSERQDVNSQIIRNITTSLTSLWYGKSRSLYIPRNYSVVEKDVDAHSIQSVIRKRRQFNNTTRQSFADFASQKRNGTKIHPKTQS